MHMAWSEYGSDPNATGDLNTQLFREANNYEGDNDPQHADFAKNGEMTANKVGNRIWVYFGAALDEDTTNERYGVGMIEVWVR